MQALQNNYDQDFYAWIQENVALIRAGKLSEMDAEHVAEELESMGKSEKRELISRLAVLMAHLLKWKFQSERRNNSWRNTIDEQRDEVIELIEDSPSLQNELEEKLNRAYKRAILIASTETSLPKTIFPTTIPFSLSQLLHPEFFVE